MELLAKRKKSKSMRSGAKSQSSGFEHRQNLSQLRAKVKSAEKALGVLAIEKKQTEVDMAKPGFYDGRKTLRKLPSSRSNLPKLRPLLLKLNKTGWSQKKRLIPRNRLSYNESFPNQACFII